MKDVCNLVKIIGILFSIFAVIGVVFYFVFCKFGCKRCACVKNKANKVFNEMGELIGEITYCIKK